MGKLTAPWLEETNMKTKLPPQPETVRFTSTLVSVLPIDVGFDLRLHDMVIDLRPACPAGERFTIRYALPDGTEAVLENVTMKQAYAALNRAGYLTETLYDLPTAEAQALRKGR